MAEKSARLEFKKIYKREADLNWPADANALSIIAYQLYPPEKNPAIDAVAAGIFKNIYKREPKRLSDRALVDAIGYGGAQR
jgi:hypothetical protein